MAYDSHQRWRPCLGLPRFGSTGLYEEETALQRQQAAEAEAARINSVPGLLPPQQALPDEMADEL